MKKTLLILASLLCPLLAVHATVTINIEGGALFGTDTSSPLADGSLVIAVASTDGIFSGPVAGSFTSGSEILLGSWLIDSEVAGPGSFSAALTLLELTDGGLATGQTFRMVWFAGEITDAASLVEGTRYGAYRDSDWLIPTDGFIESFGFETEFIGGALPDSVGVAGEVIAPIPEPATCVLLAGLACLACAAVRRYL